MGPILSLAILVSACSENRPTAPPASAPPNPPPAASRKVREAAVAGMFYPRDAAQLGQMLDALLAPTHAESVPDLAALISPHAGYQFSGSTAAIGYKTLAGRDIQTVLLLAPSHYAAFRGAFVTSADIYRTPLGDVPISPKARELVKLEPFTSAPAAQVRRPDWWRQSPISIPPFGEDTPETWEHSGEVQVPFLQKVLSKFQLIPIVFGDVDPEQVARVLAGYLDERTLVIASSDLSHYHPYDEARELDRQCIGSILDLQTALGHEAACGAGPILTVVHLAKVKGWKPKLLDYRNSGDTAGDKRGVVGYATIAFGRPGPSSFNRDERQALLDLARRTLLEAVENGRVPEVDPASFPKKFTEPSGCFVTLTKQGMLRGCIGHILPQEPLYRAVMDNAVNAALRDQRFRPVQTNELDQIEIEVSVLTRPQALASVSPEDLLAKLRPHVDGVVLEVDGKGATYLPQVWTQIPDKVQFLDSLAQKAGAAPGDWRKPDAHIHTYQVEAFRQSER